MFLFPLGTRHSLQHSDYVRDVFMLLHDPETGRGGAKRRDVLMFLRELFNMAKTLQVRIMMIICCQMLIGNLCGSDAKLLMT